METASTRKTAMKIHSSLLNKIAVMGQRKFADAMGVHESQVSRWKSGLLETMSMALAVLNYGIADEEMAELAKRLAGYLSPKKTPRKLQLSRRDCEWLDQFTGIIMPGQNAQVNHDIRAGNRFETVYPFILFARITSSTTAMFILTRDGLVGAGRHQSQLIAAMVNKQFIRPTKRKKNP